jgi:hypothetical protein
MAEIITDIENLHKRADILNKNYFENAILKNNELVIELCMEFLELNKFRIQNQSTILCRYKDTISTFFL